MIGFFFRGVFLYCGGGDSGFFMRKKVLGLCELGFNSDYGVNIRNWFFESKVEFNESRKKDG